MDGIVTKIFQHSSCRSGKQVQIIDLRLVFPARLKILGINFCGLTGNRQPMLRNVENFSSHNLRHQLIEEIRKFITLLGSTNSLPMLEEQQTRIRSIYFQLNEQEQVEFATVFGEISLHPDSKPNLEAIALAGEKK